MDINDRIQKVRAQQAAEQLAKEQAEAEKAAQAAAALQEKEAARQAEIAAIKATPEYQQAWAEANSPELRAAFLAWHNQCYRVTDAPQKRKWLAPKPYQPEFNCGVYEHFGDHMSSHFIAVSCPTLSIGKIQRYLTGTWCHDNRRDYDDSEVTYYTLNLVQRFPTFEALLDWIAAQIAQIQDQQRQAAEAKSNRKS